MDPKTSGAGSPEETGTCLVCPCGKAYRIIGGEIVELSKEQAEVMQEEAASSSQSVAGSPEETKPLYRPLKDCRRALAESIEQTLRYGFGKPNSQTDTWEKRVSIIESAFSSYEVVVRAASSSQSVAGSPEETKPEPDWKALCKKTAKILLDHMNDADYELSLAGIYAMLTEDELDGGAASSSQSAAHTPNCEYQPKGAETEQIDCTCAPEPPGP